MAPTCNVKQKTMTRAQVGQVIRSTSCSSSPSTSSSSSSPSAPGSPSSSSESAVSIGNKRSPMTANNEPPKKRYKPQPDKDSQIVKASNNNKMTIEAPLLKDFTKEFGIPTSQFVWGPRETTPEEESFDEDETAPPPSIPNAYQRDPGSRRGRALAVLTKNVNPTPARYQNRTQRGRRGVLRNSPAPEPRPRLPIRIKVKSPRRLSFMGLPAEVREQIYRGLLVSRKPIPVYSSWRRVYQREKPGLDISILMVSKKVFVEARGVMYGENIFLYLLRDAPTQYHEVANIQGLVSDDIYVPEPGMRDQENIANRDTDPLALPIHEPGTIDTAKYAQYFRFITVKADSSRSTPSTKEFMVDAIKMFAKTPYNANIHTLKIIISPSFKHGKFTFVDFFKPASELMVALKSLPCEIIHVQILNKLLNNGAWPSSTDLILRAHQLRFYRQLALQEREDKRKDEGDDRDFKGQSSDLFRTDAKMKNFRFNKLCWIHQKMAQLSKFILQACEKCAQDDDDKQSNTGGAPPGATDDDEDDWYIYEHDELEESEEEDQDFVQPSDNESDYEA